MSCLKISAWAPPLRTQVTRIGLRPFAYPISIPTQFQLFNSFSLTSAGMIGVAPRPFRYSTSSPSGGVSLRRQTFKVQLFRFIDVLPPLKTPSQIKRLVDEYFGQDTGLRDAPGGRSLMRWGMRALSSVGFGAGVTADTIYNQAIQMANQFIVGAGTKEALPAVAD